MHLKSIFKNAIFVSLWILTLVGVARFCHHATHGFCLSKIHSNLIKERLPQLASENDREFINTLFQQKFRFLGRGLQSFVFESEDKEYVLKLFNNRYQRKIQFFSLLAHFPCARSWALSQRHYFQEKLLKTFNSYQIAFEEMKEKTGLLYIHLNPTTNLTHPVTLIDCLNIQHKINPNEMGFLIQKKATLVYPALKKYLSNQDLEGAQQALISLIALFFWKWHHAINDNDPLIRTNYGFIDGKAIQIDVGPLAKQISPPNIEQRLLQIDKITASLKFWLNENEPSLLPFLDQELQKQLSSEE
jgi:hypothetical protein